MAVLLKNLVARAPRVEDLDAISELLAACEKAGYGLVDTVRENVLAYWQQSAAYLANDAWVIVTTRGQIVGFACVWQSDVAHISAFVGVAPEYRKRGIGTLLLRLVEERARQSIRQAPAHVRVGLLVEVSAEDRWAQRLLEREGYQAGHRFLRVFFAVAEDTGVLALAAHPQFRTEINLEQGRRADSPVLYDQDGLCSVQFYVTYEKELRPAVPGDSNAARPLHTLASLR